MFWLTTWIRSGLIQITLADLLALEETYPSLVSDIDRVIWQVELIKQQVKADG